MYLDDIRAYIPRDAQEEADRRMILEYARREAAALGAEIGGTLRGFPRLRVF